MKKNNSISRRRFLEQSTALGALASFQSLMPAYATETVGQQPISNLQSSISPIDLAIEDRILEIEGRETTVTTINGTIPGPLIRLREGEDVTLRVTNKLQEDTSIHWHGIILPAPMDGVPGISFAGIKPEETFVYKFPITQSGTYWYHSHSGLQEQLGVYGPLVIDPAGPEPVSYDREHVIVLGDWTFESPYKILAKLKKNPGYYNYQRRTMKNFFHDVSNSGLKDTISDRRRWNRMRMDPTDISDITGHTYTYIMNGAGPETNWTGLFKPGEKIRLRFINAAAASYFDVRIPGLKMTVIAADGQDVKPVPVDEFRIANAETYDVIVEPEEDRAYTVYAEAIDRSGFARGTLAPRLGMSAEIPERRKRPLLTMADMGMGDMAEMEKMDDASPDMKMDGPMKMEDAAATASDSAGAAPHENMDDMPDMNSKWTMNSEPVPHGPDDHGPGNASIPMMTKSMLDEPGFGLKDNGRRVLVYSDLKGIRPNSDMRKPGRTIELHLTGNMERYMWSFDGKKYSEVDGPVQFHLGERLRLTLVNDTMMNHPIHLHGMWMELDNGFGMYNPKKHTINLKPAERISLDITADAPGEWAFHCHIMYHLAMGMFRVVSVT